MARSRAGPRGRGSATSRSADPEPRGRHRDSRTGRPGAPGPASARSRACGRQGIASRTRTVDGARALLRGGRRRTACPRDPDQGQGRQALRRRRDGNEFADPSGALRRAPRDRQPEPARRAAVPDLYDRRPDLRERRRARPRPPAAALRRRRRAARGRCGRLRARDGVQLQPAGAGARARNARMTEVHRSHLWQLIAINAIWGLNIVAVKLSADRFPPVFLTFLRFLIVGLVVWPWLRLRRGEMRWLLVAATCSGGLQFALMYSGVAVSGNMSSVAIAGQLGVPFATLLSVAVLSETIHWRRRLGIALSFAGVVIIGFSPEVLDSAAGLLLIVIAAFVGAIGLVAVKRVHELEPLQLQAWLAWGSLPILLPLSLLLEDGQLATLREAGPTGWGALLYSAVLASLVAHTAYFALIRRYPVSSVAPVTVLTPLFSVFFSVVLLGDLLDARMIVGGLLTLTGVTVIVVRERNAAATGT